MSLVNKGDYHEPLLFSRDTLYRSALCRIEFGLNACRSSPYIHSGYANDWSLLRGNELSYTYGETIVENMWTSGRWAYSTHSIFIGNYAGGPFGPQDIDFDVTYVCEIQGTNRLERVF